MEAFGMGARGHDVASMVGKPFAYDCDAVKCVAKGVSQEAEVRADGGVKRCGVGSYARPPLMCWFLFRGFFCRSLSVKYIPLY